MKAGIMVFTGGMLYASILNLPKLFWLCLMINMVCIIIEIKYNVIPLIKQWKTKRDWITLRELKKRAGQ